jgi:orotate phosphoribosyltransferase
MVLASSTLNESIVTQFKEDGLIREGHFAYRSGRHSAVLLDRDRLLADPRAASQMGYALAKAFFTEKIHTVAAPSIWGAGLAQWVAYFLEPRARIVYPTPMADGTRQIARTLFDLIEGKRVLLVDNLMLSGETIKQFDCQITELGGEVLGVGCLWAGAELEENHHEVFGLLNSRYPAYLPEDCPLCREHHEQVEIIPY